MGERGGVRDLMRDSCRAVRRPSRCVYERTGHTARPRDTPPPAAPLCSHLLSLSRVSLTESETQARDTSHAGLRVARPAACNCNLHLTRRGRLPVLGVLPLTLHHVGAL